MLSQGKLSVDDADRLLKAALHPDESITAQTETDEKVGGGDRGPSIPVPRGASTAKKSPPRFVRIVIEMQEENINIKAPIALLRAGLNFGLALPKEVRLKLGHDISDGIGFDPFVLAGKNINPLINALGEGSILVKSSKSRVYISVE